MKQIAATTTQTTIAATTVKNHKNRNSSSDLFVQSTQNCICMCIKSKCTVTSVPPMLYPSVRYRSLPLLLFYRSAYFGTPTDCNKQELIFFFFKYTFTFCFYFFLLGFFFLFLLLFKNSPSQQQFVETALLVACLFYIISGL